MKSNSIADLYGPETVRCNVSLNTEKIFDDNVRMAFALGFKTRSGFFSDVLDSFYDHIQLYGPQKGVEKFKEKLKVR